MFPPLPHAAQQASMHPSRGHRTTKWRAWMVCRACPGLIRMVAGRLLPYRRTSGRFARSTARPVEGQPRSYLGCRTSVEGQLRSKAPAVTPSRIGSRAPGSSDGVCLMAVTRRGSSGAKLQPSHPRESGAELPDPRICCAYLILIVLFLHLYVGG